MTGVLTCALPICFPVTITGVLVKGKLTVDLGAKEGNLGRTKQGPKKECDINWIVEKSRRTGMLVSGNKRRPLWADVSEVPSFGEAMMIVKEAQEKFEGLDPKIRRRFGNDPMKLIQYLENPELDINEAVELGLLNKPISDANTTTTNDDVNATK